MKNPTKVSLSFILLFSLSNFIGRYPAVGQNNSLNASKTLFEVGVVLDLGTPLGKMSKTCISMALDDFYTAHNNYTTRLNLTWMDSNQDIVDAASMAQNLLKNVQVKAIIGPQASDQAQFVAAMGNKAHVPILSFSATSPFLSTIQTPYFIRTALSDSSQVKAIAALIKAFEWREVVQIFEDTPYGNGMIPFITDALLDVEARVPYRSVISHLMNDEQIAEELDKLKTMQTRIFIVHLSPSLSYRLFFKANEVEMTNEGYVWIVTDGLVNLLDSMNSSVIQSMQGVLGVRPNVPKSKELDSFMERWKRRFQNENPYFRVEPNIFGLWAYDTVWALAKAIEEVQQTGQNSTDLAGLGVSEIGPRLRDAILKTNFKGLSGRFNLTKGQLEPSTFQIVNVIGKGDRVVGFWTPILGLDKKLNSSKTTYSTSKADLTPIIWPGEPLSEPKGWVIPTSRKKLKIGVPKRLGFTEFVNAVLNPETNKTEAEGYCIKVFKAAVKRLPYAIEYEFSVYQNEHGEPNGSYNDLIMEVYKKNLDAVVGDTTIVANRSFFVDFTLPYTESGVTMVVLSTENKSKAWIFLKPLSWDLWLMTGLAFTLTGFVVWVLEHRVNEEFRGPLQDQIGVILWFSFSTLVFAHSSVPRERLVNNGSRFAVIIWVFVVWILTTYYTASFTTLLTLQQLEPTINDIQDLIKKGDNVGYQKGTFVVDLLKHLKVDDSKFREFETAEEFGEALSNGTVGAIFDEIPYLRSFLAKKGNCAKYKMVGPIYKTDGFGFVFPRGSPLVPDLSRAILNLTEGDDMKTIEKDIGPVSTCSDQPTTAQSNSLTLGSFWGLFLISGAASLLALSIYLFSFLKRNRHVLTTRDPNLSLRQRLTAIFRRFHERDISHHTFKRRARPNESLEMATIQAENSPPVDASVPTTSSNPNGRDSIFLTEPEDVEQHFQTFNCEPVARRRWNLLSKAWRFRTRYAHLHEYN